MARRASSDYPAAGHARAPAAGSSSPRLLAAVGLQRDTASELSPDAVVTSPGPMGSWRPRKALTPGLGGACLPADDASTLTRAAELPLTAGGTPTTASQPRSLFHSVVISFLFPTRERAEPPKRSLNTRRPIGTQADD